MTETMWGADVEALEALAAQLRGSARELEGIQGRVGARVRTTAWTGADAGAFRQAWDRRHTHQVAGLVRSLAEAADTLARNASEQRATSAGGTGAPVGAAVAGGPSVVAADDPAVASARATVTRALDTGGWGVTRSDLGDVRQAVEGLDPAQRAALVASLTPQQVAVLRDQMQESRLKGGWTHGEQASFFQLFADRPDALRTLLAGDRPAAVPGTDQPVRFDGVADVAQHGLQRDLDGAAKNEITVVARDDGTYLVHLPGVTDLSTGLGQGVVGSVAAANPLTGGLLANHEWNAPNASDSPRDMRWGKEASQAGDVSGGSWENPYAASVRMALQEAGAPPGGTVVLTGHSFGAYTAMELAADRTFNRTDGTGYDVAAVLAMGADVDWRMDDVPPNTVGLVINNTHDVAFRSESALGRNPDESAVPSTWREIVFDGGVVDGAGHGLGNYVDWIAAHPDELPPELGGAGGGTSTQYAVHDIYR